MATSTVAQMTPSELKELLESVVEVTVEQKLLEILGDPDDGLELRESVRVRIEAQRAAVSRGEYGRSLDEVVEDLGLD